MLSELAAKHTPCETTASSLVVVEAEGTLKSDGKLVRSSTRASRRNARGARSGGDSKVRAQPYEKPNGAG